MPFPPEAPDKIRERLALGTLPQTRPPRMWASHGRGTICAGCDQPITPDQVEYEFGNGQSFEMHIGCAAVWEAERKRMTNRE